MHQSTADFARQQMISQQIRTWEVIDDGILGIIGGLRRELFVPDAYRDVAYADWAIPLGHGQHMLPPMLAGRILQAVAVRPGEFVLEGGTGSGYLSACLAMAGARVMSHEIHADLASRARSNLAQAGVPAVDVHHGDVLAQLGGASRYDVVILTGSLPRYEPRFEELLKPGGRLFVVTGSGPVMEARLVTRAADGSVRTEGLFDTCIDPLENVAVEPAFRF
ncbi:MAG: hypothetical protein RL026_1883 [Pseudomonadota bacterium]